MTTTATTSSTREEMLEHLVAARLAGDVLTTVANTRTKIEWMLAGNPVCTFGLSDWRSADEAEVAQALELTAGAWQGVEDESRGFIDPAHTLAGMDRHAAALAPFLADGGANVLLATGHPMGLLAHYMELARALRSAGNRILTAHDGGAAIVPAGQDGVGRDRTVRFVGSVACAFDGMALHHTHLSTYMEVMLDELASHGTPVDLVVADHGMAGAAVERGIPTISIADINDPALPLAHLRGRHRDVLVIDDNIAPVLFEPVTQYILERVRG